MALLDVIISGMGGIGAYLLCKNGISRWLGRENDD